MSNDQFDKLPIIQASGEELIIIDETNSIRSTTVRPLEGAARKRAEQYWADMKKYHPEEYQEMLKRWKSRTDSEPPA